MQSIIKVGLIAADFKNALYADNINSPIGRAIKRQFPKVKSTIAYIDKISIDYEFYSHLTFDVFEFGQASNKARKLNYNDEVIKSITLTKMGSNQI